MKLQQLFTNEWPEQVNQYAEEMTQLVLKSQEDKEVIAIDGETQQNIFKDLISFLSNQSLTENGDFKVTGEELIEAINRSAVIASMFEMKEKGLIEWMDDENGDEQVYLTEKGQQLRNAED